MTKILRTSKELFKSVKSIYITMLVFCIIFMIVTYYITDLFGGALLEGDEEGIKSLSMAVIFFGVCVISASLYLTKNNIKKIDKSNGLNKKIRLYHREYVKRLGAVGASIFFSIIYYLLSANFNIFIFTAILFAVLMLVKPTSERIFNELQLTDSEMQELIN